MKNLYFIYFLLAGNILIAQPSYKEGEIILNDGQVIKGFLSFTDIRNPQKVNFKDIPEAKPIEYLPENIKGFNVNGQKYVSASVDVEISSQNLNAIDNNKNLSFRKDDTFLLTLIDEDKKLFLYKDKNDKLSFYILTEKGYELLVSKKYLRTDKSGQESILEVKQYLAQLKDYLEDCELKSLNKRQTTYDKKFLISVFREYYKCKNKNIEDFDNVDGFKLEYAAHIGPSYNLIKFGGIGFVGLSEGGYKRKLYPTAGVQLNLLIPHTDERLYLDNEINYSSYYGNGQVVVQINLNQTAEIKNEMGFRNIKLMNMLRYHFPLNKNLKLFARIGIGNGISFDFKNYQKLKSNYLGIEQVTEGVALNDLRKYEQSLVFDLGLKRNQYSITFRNEVGNGFSAYQNLGTTTSRLAMLLGITF